MVFFRQWFTNIERWERHEYICLEECHEKFEKPEWKWEKPECSTSIVRQYLFTDEYDNWDENHPDEDIEKKTHREWSNTDEFTSKVEPSDEDTDDLLSDRVTMEVEEVVLELMHWTLESECRELSEHDHREWEDECRREVRIDWTQVRSEPLIRRWENHEIHHESEEVPEKYDNHKSSEKPDISMCSSFVSEKWSNIGDQSRDNIESEGPQSGESLRTDRHREESYEHKKKCHKKPRREYRIRDMESSDHPISDIGTMRCRDMRSDVFCSNVRRFEWCHSGSRNRGWVYEITIFLQVFVSEKKNPPMKEDFLPNT